MYCYLNALWGGNQAHLDLIQAHPSVTLCIHHCTHTPMLSALFAEDPCWKIKLTSREPLPAHRPLRVHCAPDLNPHVPLSCLISPPFLWASIQSDISSFSLGQYSVSPERAPASGGGLTVQADSQPSGGALHRCHGKLWNSSTPKTVVLNLQLAIHFYKTAHI